MALYCCFYSFSGQVMLIKCSVDRRGVYRRAKWRCDGCWKYLAYDEFERHHIYWKSQYRYDDRDDEWNWACLCKDCHHSIHNGNRELDQKLKGMADLRKPKEERSKVLLKHITRKQRTTEREKELAKQYKHKKLEYFKETHGGLTPSQYNYRKQKEYYRKISWQTNANH